MSAGSYTAFVISPLPLPPVAAIVKFGYVPVIVTFVPAVSETTWSGLVLVTVKFGYVPVT